MARIRNIPNYLALAVLLVLGAPALAQSTSQFLPEADFYYYIPADNHPRLPDARLWVQAKETREAGDATSLEIGPSLDFLVKPWDLLSAISLFDIDQAKSRPLIASLGYRYLPNSSSTPTNRFEPILTFNAPLHRVKVLFTDRNRLDLDWNNGVFTWRYRNRIQFERHVPIGRYHITPYAMAEFFYESEYSKWADTALYAGCFFHIGRHYQLNPYYEHQNFTGKSPNQQYNQFGLMLNIFYGKK